MEHFKVLCLFVIFLGVCQDSYSTPCGSRFNSSTGVIESPNYPSDYPPNLECEWYIEDPNRQRITLNADTFNLENCDGCDYLEIRNGDSATSPLLGIYCFSNIPRNVTSVGHQIYLKMRTDASVQYSGFMLAWGSATTGSAHHGGHFYAPDGTITSPNYPAPYPNDLVRDWIIEAPRYHVSVLDVKKFEMEPNAECEYDYLEIKSRITTPTENVSSEATWTLLGHYCRLEDIPKNITIIGNRILLRFRSNGLNAYAGFVIDWHSKPAWDANLTTGHGTISTPNYPEPYSASATCNWNLRVPAGSIIQLILVHLQFDVTEKCRSDFLEIYDENNARGKKLGSYCQSIYHPLYIETTSNVASISLRSDSGAPRWFQIIYHTIFHNKLRGSKGVIESPNYPNKYPHRENCSWTIEAPIGNTLNLKFSEFDLKAGLTNSCSIDYLTIAEGEDDVLNREIGKFCNSNRPPLMIVSTQRHLFLHFHSDNSDPGNGFRLEWDVIVKNTIPPPPRTCLVWNDPVPKRDDYTYTLGIGGHKLHTEAVTWNEARITCEEEGGYLTVINSDAELNIIAELLSRSETITGSQSPNLTSIGFHDLYSEGQFVTIHGQALGKTGFFQWGNGEPDNNNGSENCGAISTGGDFSDIDCRAKYGFICEVPMY